jgi:hypothetical protein
MAPVIGFYLAEVAAQEQRPCPTGKFKSNLSFDECQSCPVGKFTAANASTFCFDCPAGYHGPLSTSNSCSACDGSAGDYQDQFGNGGCKTCAALSCAAARNGCGGASSGYCVDCPPGRYILKYTAANVSTSACADCSSGKYQSTTNAPSCTPCPSGKYQSLAGQPFCESVEEGLFVSDEPAEVLDQQLKLPNAGGGALSENIERALIEKLAEQLGIDTQYISLGGATDGALRQRALRDSLTLRIKILTDDSGALVAALSALTSDLSFWSGVNDRLVENSPNATRFNASGVEVVAAVLACNDNFKYNNATQTCVAVPISCGVGTFAAAGTGECADCPTSKYVDEAGASGCKSCAPGRFGESSGSSSCTDCVLGSYQPSQGQSACSACPAGKYSIAEGNSACTSCAPGSFGNSNGASLCAECAIGTYQPGAGLRTCLACPVGKFANDISATICSEVQNAKSYVTAKALGENGGPDTGMQDGKVYIEVQCPKAGLNNEVSCGGGLLSFRTTGFFHDGLQASGAAHAEWKHRKGVVLDETTMFYQCPCFECCQIDEVMGNLSCSAGSYGILCGSCSAGYFKQPDKSCKTCDAVPPLQTAAMLATSLIAGVLALSWLVRLILRRNASLWEHYTTTKDFLVVCWRKWQGMIIPVAKQFLGFFQIVLLLQSVYRIPYPTIYLKFLRFFAVINLDFLSFIRLECFVDNINWHTNVQLTATICSFCLVGTAAAFIKPGDAIQQAKKTENADRTPPARPRHKLGSVRSSATKQGKPGICARVSKRVSEVLLVLGYLIYPGANAVFFQTLNCQTIDEVSYLRNDFSIDCSLPAHKSATYLAVSMVLVFSIGLPLLYLKLLYPHRFGFAAQSGRSAAGLEDVRALRFFYIDYKPEYYFWEVLECLRKLLLTGVAIQVAPGSLIQLVVSIFVIMLYLAAVAFFQPYRTKRDNTLALAIYSVLALTLFCGLLLKVKDGYESTGKYDDGFNDTAVAVMLVSSVIVVAATAVLITIYDIRRLLSAPLLRFAHSGCVVMMPPLASHQKFDLFLSHAQDLGQDQVATIKALLEKLLPGVKVFLDVECLDDLHTLDDLIRSSAAVLVFLTEGCLRRHFIRLEIETAVKSAIKLIIVQETDCRHGSAPMSRHREDCAEAVRGALFDDAEHKEIAWIRARHFKPVSIKQIVQRMLVAQGAECPEIQLSGELARCGVRLPPLSLSLGEHHFWLANSDNWCTKLSLCLQESMPGLEVRLEEPGTLASLHLQGSAKRWTKERARTKTFNLKKKKINGYSLGTATALDALEHRYPVNTEEEEEAKQEEAPKALAHAMLLPLNKHTLTNPKVSVHAICRHYEYCFVDCSHISILELCISILQYMILQYYI